MIPGLGAPLPLAVELFDCPPLAARLTVRGCETNRRRRVEAAARSRSKLGQCFAAELDASRFAACETCPGAEALAAERHTRARTRAGIPTP